MLKIKKTLLQNNRLYPVFQELMASPMDMKAAYKMKRYADKLDQAQKAYLTFMNDMLKEHGEHDAEGSLVIEYQGEGEEKKAVGYKLKSPEAFEAAVKEYMDLDIEVEGVHPLFAVELSGVKISPNDLTIMEPFIADLENL